MLSELKLWCCACVSSGIHVPTSTPDVKAVSEGKPGMFSMACSWLGMHDFLDTLWLYLSQLLVVVLGDYFDNLTTVP